VYDATGELAAEYSTVSTTSGLQFIKVDPPGSTRVVADANQAVIAGQKQEHMPFGGSLLASQNGRTTAQGYGVDEATDVLARLFTGKERDAETGLDYFGARYFPGAQGRLTSPDPVFFQAEMLADPQRFNPCDCVRNNPLRYVDPKGEAIELFSDPAEREKQMQVLCGLAWSDACKQYLYVDDNYKKGHYYVGIVAGGQSGKGGDFGSLNGVIAALQGIIKDPYVVTVDFVQGSARVPTPPGGGPSLNINHAGGATLSVNGQLHLYVRASGDQKGYSSIPFYDMSNRWTFTSGTRDHNTVLDDELGHLLYDMRHESIVPSKSNDAPLSPENQVRKARDPNAPTRTGH
jgi:RHS repeat-associated protein